MVSGTRDERERVRLTAMWGNVRWETHRLGGWHTDFEGWGLRIRASPDGEGFRVSIVRNMVGESKTARNVYATVEDAKLGCMEAVLWGMKNMRLRPPEPVYTGTPADCPGWEEMTRRVAQARADGTFPRSLHYKFSKTR